VAPKGSNQGFWEGVHQLERQRLWPDIYSLRRVGDVSEELRRETWPTPCQKEEGGLAVSERNPRKGRIKKKKKGVDG